MDTRACKGLLPFPMISALTHTSGDIRITLQKEGARHHTRMSYPVHCGLYSEVETREWLLHFNLNHEIIRAKGKSRNWPHPHEWLKRNMGNDWIYYSTGGYTGVFEATGEYYLPNLPYKTNGLLGGDPFSDACVGELISAWPAILQDIDSSTTNLPGEVRTFLDHALEKSPEILAAKADQLFSICGGRSTVLPPDARHVDYNVIPLTIATGCLYKCRFCEVKNKRPFAARTDAEINGQIEKLRVVYDRDLPNYTSLFLGEHDALQAGSRRILNALDSAYTAFAFADGYMQGCSVFSFRLGHVAAQHSRVIFPGTRRSAIQGLYQCRPGISGSGNAGPAWQATDHRAGHCGVRPDTGGKRPPQPNGDYRKFCAG